MMAIRQSNETQKRSSEMAGTTASESASPRVRNLIKANAALLRCAGLAVILIAGIAAPSYAETRVSWLNPHQSGYTQAGAVVSPIGVASSNDGGIDGAVGLDLAIVLDASGSMFWQVQDSDMRNIDAAIDAAMALVAGLPAETTSVSVISFGRYARINLPLTSLTDMPAVFFAIAIASHTRLGATNLDGAIATAHIELASRRHTPGRSQQIILISDGQGYYAPHGAAAIARAGGITVHTVGVAGHYAAAMSLIAKIGGGTYTDGSDLRTLRGLFNGTEGNLVGIAYVDIVLPDGSTIRDIAVDGLGHFALPRHVIELGANTFTATAYGTDGTSASAEVTLYGDNFYTLAPRRR
jgi:Ca-activated chloride channel family protein